MGNCIQMKKTIKISSLTTSSAKELLILALSKKENKLSLVNNLSKKNWLNVIDFLKFDELKEIGKVSR